MRSKAYLRKTRKMSLVEPYNSLIPRLGEMLLATPVRL